MFRRPGSSLDQRPCLEWTQRVRMKALNRRTSLHYMFLFCKFIHTHTHIYIYIYIYIIFIYIQSHKMHANIHTYMRTYIHACMHTRIHTCILAYKYTNMYTYKQKQTQYKTDRCMCGIPVYFF